MKVKSIYRLENLILRIDVCRETDRIVFYELHPLLWDKEGFELWKLRRRKCIDIIGRFGVFQEYPIVALVIEPSPSPQPNIIGKVSSVQHEGFDVRFIEYGKLQLNIDVELKIALLWEAYIYDTCLNEYSYLLAKALLLVEKMLKELGVKEVYANGYEPCYPELYKETLTQLGYRLIRKPHVYYKKL